VTLRYRDQTGWTSSKIISRLVSLQWGIRSANITDLLQREHLEILTGIEVGYGKKWLSAYKSSNMSEMRQESIKVTIENQYALSIDAKY